MKKNNKNRYLTAILVLLLLITGGNVFASPVLFSSPQNDATTGRIRSDADNFLSVRDYANLDFNKWFSVISFKNALATNFYTFAGISPSEMAQAGFATNFGKLYMALYYGGNAWKSFGNANVFNYSEQNISGKNMRVYNNLPAFTFNRDLQLYNEAALLFGIGDLMGIRLAYAHSFQSVKVDNDFAVINGGSVSGYDYFKSYKEGVGNINPEISWGLAKELIPGRGIKPEVKVDLMFYKNYIQKEEYTDNTRTETKGTEIVKSQNEVTLGITASLGGFTFARINDFSFGADMEYGFSLLIPFGNEYSYEDATGKYQIAKFKGSGNKPDQGESYRETGMNQHIITPSFGASWQGNRLNISSRLGFEMTLRKNTLTDLRFKEVDDGTGNMRPNTEGTLVKSNRDETTSFFAFAPVLGLGMQWGIVPNILFLNIGGEISFGIPYFWTQEQKTYNQGVEDKSRYSKFKRNTANGTDTQTTGAST
ncbi:MAG: hypothetical protein FWH41_03305, partial [Treponema sp.]|nr:hypothetical protein [Treponema sp.]